MEDNLLIATHDSASGEKPIWWSILLTPFARTQSKTIGEQFNHGCTLFDIRVKKVFGVWRCAHGWWFTKRTFKSIISELDFYAQCDQTIRVMITYEGKEKNASEFVEYIKDIKKQYQHIKYGPICAKYGNDTNGIKVNYSKPLIKEDDNWCPYKSIQAFLPLDGKTWQTYIPIPWLWKKIYHNKVIFNTKEYKFVDFL